MTNKITMQIPSIDEECKEVKLKQTVYDPVVKCVLLDNTDESYDRVYKTMKQYTRTENREYMRFCNRLEKLLSSNKYGKALALCNSYGEITNVKIASGPNLYYVQPRIDMYKLIYKAVKDSQCESIYSIGAGNGIFERLLTEYTAIPVIGVEVNSHRCPGCDHEDRYDHLEYCGGLLKYLSTNDRIFVKNEQDTYLVPKSSTIMFVYGYPGSCWEEYLKEYLGNLVIIVSGRNLACIDPKLDCLTYEPYANHWKQHTINTYIGIAIYSRIQQEENSFLSEQD